jgi:hypothetical protein
MIVITGKPNYVTKKIAENKARGFIVEKKHVHPDGSITVRMIEKTQ